MPSVNKKNTTSVQIKLEAGQKLLKVTEVQIKRTESNFAFSPVDPSQYVIDPTGKSVTLKQKKQVAEMKVIYEVDTDPEKFQETNPEAFAVYQKIKNAVEPDMRATAEKVKVSKVLEEGAPHDSVNQVIGDMQSIMSGGKPNFLLSKRAKLVKLTPEAGGGLNSKNTENVNELTKLFGTSVSTKSALNEIFTDGSPGAALGTFKNKFPILKRKPKLLKQLTEKVKPQKDNLSEKVFGKLGDTLENLNEGNSSISQVTKQVKQTHKNQLSQKNNVAANLNPKGILSSASRSGQNVMGQDVAGFKGLFDKLKSGNIFGQIKSIASGVTAKLADGKLPPNIIEGTDDLGIQSLDTNLSEVIANSGIVATSPDDTSVRSEAVNNSSFASGSGFSGYTTSDSYEFKIIGLKQFRKDLAGAERMKTSSGDKEIRGMVVSNTDPLWGGLNTSVPLDAKELHNISKQVALETVIKEVNPHNLLTKFEAKKKAEETVRKGKEFGIQAHYVILTNGSLQRGRPIDETRSSRFAVRTKSAFEVLIVASSDNPPNPSQLQTLEEVIKIFYSLVDGGDLSSMSEVEGLGIEFINLQTYRDKFGKTSDTNLNEDELPSKLEKVLTKPTDIAKTSKTKKNQEITIGQITKKFERINEVDGTEIQQDIDSKLDEFSKIADGISGNYNTKLSQAENAKHLNFGDKFRSGLEADIKKTDAFLDKQTGTLDNLIKDFKLDGSGAKKLGKVFKR